AGGAALARGAARPPVTGELDAPDREEAAVELDVRLPRCLLAGLGALRRHRRRTFSPITGLPRGCSLGCRAGRRLAVALLDRGLHLPEALAGLLGDPLTPRVTPLVPVATAMWQGELGGADDVGGPDAERIGRTQPLGVAQIVGDGEVRLAGRA